tara:strand:- start:124 stop:270 length:147 start_codon:yes stop_codon:yes gene_type:complete
MVAVAVEVLVTLLNLALVRLYQELEDQVVVEEVVAHQIILHLMILQTV